MTAEDWRARANCRGVDPDEMQPEVATPEQVEAAKRFCHGCPVRTQCLQLALDQPGAYGIHGGVWFGEAPALLRLCEWCQEPLLDSVGGPLKASARFCGGTCTKRARRAARAAEALSA